MSSSFIDEVLEREGSEFTNYPEDKGGPTKFGITLNTLSDYRNVKCSVKDVKNLTEEEARQIYNDLFIEKSPFKNLPNPIRDFLLDWAVNSGPTAPATALQNILNEYGGQLKVDGKFGAISQQMFNTVMNNWGIKVIYERLLAERLRFYAKLIVKDNSQGKFALGWINRVLSFWGQ